MQPDIEKASAVATTLPMAQNILTKDEWNKRYWFNTLQMVTVVNPLTYDWPFMVEMRHFIIKAGGTESFPGVIANVYLDQMSKILAQNEDKLGFMADPALKKIYYDRLIVSVESLVQEQDNTPAYLKDVPQNARLEAPDNETPPWERASTVVPPTTPPPVPDEPEVPSEEPTPENREIAITLSDFELDDTKYKLVIGKDGRKLHYKNGVLTTVAEFNRAASML